MQKNSPPNARFWVFENDAWVKLTLRPDQRLAHHQSERHDEGFSYRHNAYHHTGAAVVCEWSNGGSDCDGRIDRSGAIICAIEELRSRPVTEPDGTVVMAPMWGVHSAERVHDESAQAAGY